MQVTNFGGNITYTSRHYYEPETEDDVLEILDRHVGGTIRVVASGHAWSPAIETPDVVIRMNNMNAIDIRRDDDNTVMVEAGGGTVLRTLVNTVEDTTDHTLPTMGGILKQTISGAISTGTHGSGRPSLSHYMASMRVAAYDPDSGDARIYTYNEGDALRAARCAVGRMGIILSVTFRCVPKYTVAETIREEGSVAALLERDRDDSLEQAILMPHNWRLLVYDREPRPGTLSGFARFRAAVRSVFSFVYIDVGLHVIITAVVFAVRRNIAGMKTIRTLYGTLIPGAIRKNVTSAGPSTDMITMKHELFQHEEMELFIPKRNLTDAVEIVRHIVAVAADDDTETPREHVQTALQKAGMEDALEEIRGTYIHHYVLYFRRIRPDDTLISMASGADTTYYSLSFFTYYPPHARDPFYNMCRVVAKTLAASHDVRPHWGKHNPLTYDELVALYPRIKEFHQHCRAVDPAETFGNEYTQKVVGI